MRLPAATWPAGDSALNLAPGQAALSSANRRAPRLGGCNNHLKGQIKAPLREFLCSRPHLMLRGLFKPRRGRCFKYLPPESNPPPPPQAASGRWQRRPWTRAASRWNGWHRAAAAGPGPFTATSATPRTGAQGTSVSAGRPDELGLSG